MTGSVDLGFARVDVDREARQGLPEVIYGTGKTAAEIASIACTLLRHNDGPVLATRVDADTAAAVLAEVGVGGGCGGPVAEAGVGAGVAAVGDGSAVGVRVDAGTTASASPGSCGGQVGTRGNAGAATTGSAAVPHGTHDGSASASPASPASPGACDGPAATGAHAGTATTDPAALPQGTYDAPARLLVWRPAAPIGFTVVVAAAGTADQPVAREAAAIAEAVGLTVTTVTDVGVAGLHRLLAEQDRLRAADTVIVVAGMEGALASAIGGLVACPVVAVPTSTGYGAGLEGITALLAMHASCAAGITVVNIDSGFGAAMAAFRLSRVVHRSAL